MQGVVGLVNIGHETTNVNILDDGVPVLTRDIPVGTRRFQEDLQRERSMSADEADRLLRGFERERGAGAVAGLARRGAGGGHRARGGVPPVVQPLGERARPDLHLRRRRRAFPASTRSSPTASGFRCSRPTRIERLQVADGVFDTMSLDEVAPLLMLPDGPGAPDRGVSPETRTDA